MDCKKLLLEYFWLNKWVACVKYAKNAKKFLLLLFLL